MPAGAFPGVQPDVVVITARREEGCLSPVMLCYFKAEHIPVKFERALHVGHLQVHVANPNTRIDWTNFCIHIQGRLLHYLGPSIRPLALPHLRLA